MLDKPNIEARHPERRAAHVGGRALSHLTPSFWVLHCFALDIFSIARYTIPMSDEPVVFSSSLDNLILQTYLDLLSSQDPQVRLKAARDLAEIRGHFRNSRTASSPTQINVGVTDPAHLEQVLGGLRLLGQSGTGDN